MTNLADDVDIEQGVNLERAAGRGNMLLESYISILLTQRRLLHSRIKELEARQDDLK